MFAVLCIIKALHPCYLAFCLASNPEDFLHVLIHHIGDADSWDDLKKVGGDATV